jgi:hypothetical protein
MEEVQLELSRIKTGNDLMLYGLTLILFTFTQGGEGKTSVGGGQTREIMLNETLTHKSFLPHHGYSWEADIS